MSNKEIYLDQNADPWVPVDPLGEALHHLHMNGLFYARSELTAPRGSGYVAAGQLDVQVTLDVDLDELGKPHIVRHECEPLDQPVLGPVGEVNDTPPVQWSQFAAANRVLDVKQRLSRTGAKKVHVAIGKFRRSDESNLLLLVVEAGLFQDQPILSLIKPKVLLR